MLFFCTVSGKGLFFAISVLRAIARFAGFSRVTHVKYFFCCSYPTAGHVTIPPPTYMLLFIYVVCFFFNWVHVIIYSCRQTRFGIARHSAVARKLIYTTCTFDGSESPFPLGTSPTPPDPGRYFPRPTSPVGTSYAHVYTCRVSPLPYRPSTDVWVHGGICAPPAYHAPSRLSPSSQPLSSISDLVNIGRVA